MVERLPLDAVVFDAGGTLVRLDFEWMAGLLAGLGVDVEPAGLRRAEISGRRRFDRASGLGTGTVTLTADGDALTAAYFAGMLEAAGCPVALVPTVLEQLHARQKSDHLLWSRSMEGARDALDALPALGLRACCVSNSDGRAQLHLERFGLMRGLEFVVDSHLVGVAKPDRRIFDIALERLGVHPNRAVYVGDLRAADQVGSHSAGMQFVLVDPYGDYAPPDVLRIGGLAELPALLAAHFIPPADEERRRG